MIDVEFVWIFGDKVAVFPGINFTDDDIDDCMGYCDGVYFGVDRALIATAKRVSYSDFFDIFSYLEGVFGVNKLIARGVL